MNQPEKKRKIFYEKKTSKNCTICNYLAYGAMLFNPFMLLRFIKLLSLAHVTPNSWARDNLLQQDDCAL